MRLEELNATADKTVINQAIGTASQPANAHVDVVAKLTQLKQLFDAGVITENDFTTKKEDLLKLM